MINSFVMRVFTVPVYNKLKPGGPIATTLFFSDLKINKEKAFFQIFNDRKISYSFSFPEVPWYVRSHQYPLLY